MNILLTHGSPDIRHRDQASRLAASVAQELGDEVCVSFLDDASLPRNATVLPLFLGEGRHAMQDAGLIAARYDAIILPPLSEATGRLADIAVSMASSMTGTREPSIFAFYRFRFFERLIAAVYGQRKRQPKMSMASIHGAPCISDLVAFWEREGVTTVAVQPMLLFAGQSLETLVAQADSQVLEVVLGEPMALNADMPRLIADCFRGEA